MAALGNVTLLRLGVAVTYSKLPREQQGGKVQLEGAGQFLFICWFCSDNPPPAASA